MGTLVLLHIVFASEGFVTGWAVDILLARVLLAVTRGVAGGGEGVVAVEARGMRARVFLFDCFGVGWGRSRGTWGRFTGRC